jgi:2-keto-4-pentenoate hydratase/2-oxohepta-3-ene-1,7-dioic acid hydratase in catechol pathway
MKLVTYKYEGKINLGAVRHANGRDEVVDLSSLGYARLEDLIAAGDAAFAAAAEAAESGAVALELEALQLLSPLLAPPRIFCIGLNYLDHAAESKMVVQKDPTVFMKLQSALTGHQSPIVLPRRSTQPDYEAELAVVIGKGGANIGLGKGDNWKDHIFGYTILNDVSARDIQLATTQWVLGKSFATFCPVGPWIVTGDEIEDPHALDIALSIDGEVLQQANTRDMVFTIPALLAYISGIVALEPGDIISTGTPPGVGLGRTPQRWLRPGEEVSITIEGVGTLTNPTVAERA